MKYHHQFRIAASIERVAQFHAQSTSMTAITPPPLVVKVQKAPSILADGDEMSFTMWFGPLPIHWPARIEAVSASGFTDRQLRGPFTEWVHRHIFRAVDENTTDVLDEITFRLRLHPLWWPVCLGLPIIFAFRAWKTKRMLS